MIKRIQMSNHTEKECPNAIVKCDYAHAGCEIELPLKDMNKHLDKAAKHHVMLLSRLFSDQKLEIKKVQRDCYWDMYDLERKLKEKENELEDREELIDTYEAQIKLLKRVSTLGGTKVEPIGLSTHIQHCLGHYSAKYQEFVWSVWTYLPS